MQTHFEEETLPHNFEDELTSLMDELLSDDRELDAFQALAGQLACECNGVGYDRFFEYGKFKDKDDLNEFIKVNAIGTGCGQCLKNFDYWAEVFITRR